MTDVCSLPIYKHVYSSVDNGLQKCKRCGAIKRGDRRVLLSRSNKVSSLWKKEFVEEKK